MISNFNNLSAEDNQYNSTNSLEEAKKIWNDFKNGDYIAFSKLYDVYYDSLYCYGLRFTSNKEVVKDCIHELFVKIWRTRFHLSNATNVKSYLLVSFRRIIIRELEKCRKFIGNEDINQNIFDMEVSIEHKMIEDQEIKEKVLKINKALENLTKRQKELIYLKFFEQLSYEEISSIMNLDMQSIYNLMSRSINSLRDKLSPFCSVDIAPVFLILIMHIL